MTSTVDKKWGEDYSPFRELEKKVHVASIITLWVVVIATIISWIIG